MATAGAGTRGDGAAADRLGSARKGPGDQPETDGRLMRSVFYFFWVFAIPFALAIGNVWLLIPAPGKEATAGELRRLVQAQQIPAGIVLFTIFAMIIWRFRHDLPLAAAIGVGGRRDVPPSVRGRFEDAAALVDEARRILRTRRRDVERQLTAAEREQLVQAIVALEEAMSHDRFDQAEFDAAYTRADRVIGEHLARWRKGEIREYAESIGIAVAVALLLRAFVVEAFKIPSGSMIPTLMIGDHIFVNKFSYGPLIPWTDRRLFSQLPPGRTDVMVFKYPENKEQDFIKRVIALPGDRLEAINGRPVINGWLVPHCHVGQFRDENKMVELFVEYLADRSYFTLFNNNPDGLESCDNRDHCACRDGVCGYHEGPFDVAPEEVLVMGDNRDNSSDSRKWGGVPFVNIKGRALFVWMSFGPGGDIADDRLGVKVLGRPKLPRNQEAALQPAVDKCLRDRPPISQTTPPQPSGRR